MIIDVHTHLWEGRWEQDKAALLHAMELYGISKIYVSGLGVHKPSPEQVEEANRQIAQFVREQPGQVEGYVYVSPEHSDALDVVRRGIEEQGMSGIKFWVSTLCDEPCVNPVVEAAIDYQVPILIHAFHKAIGQYEGESIGRNVAALARRYPEAKLIMAHLGGNCYNGIPAIRDLPNVWVDASGSIFREDELEYAAEFVGIDRIVFGTDMPGSYLVNLGQVLEARFDAQARDKILSGNALKLFEH